MDSKKVLSILLALILCVNLLPGGAGAKATEEKTGTVEVLRTSETACAITSAPVGLTALDGDGKVKLKDTNEVRWIDRLDLSGADYAMEFYRWLEENSDGDGTDDALIDPTAVGYFDGLGYAYAAELTGSVEFTFAPGASYAEIAEAAASAAEPVISEAGSGALSHLFAVYYAFDRDHPEVFWLSGRTMCSQSEGYRYSYQSDLGTGTVTYSITVYFLLSMDGFDVRAEDYRRASKIQEEIEERDEEVEEILAELDGCTSRYEQLRSLNEWLTTHNCYNSSSDLNRIDHDCRECVSALDGRTGKNGPVCEAYARALKVLCDELDIPCVLVDGNAILGSSSGAHMWNYVQMEDGNWYAVDVTWNDPTVSGTTSAVSGYENESYLLVGSQTVVGGKPFLDSHPVSNAPSTNSPCFRNGPVLHETAYDPNAASTPTHSYGDPTFNWSGDYSACTAAFTCSKCGDVLNKECTVTCEITGGAMVFTASATLDGREILDTRTVADAAEVIHTEIRGSTLTVSLPAQLPDTWVVIVNYDGAGRMLDCRLVPASQTEIETGVTGAHVKVLFLHQGDYVPLLSALNIL